MASVAEIDGLTISSGPAFVGLLDTYTGAAAAYSVRLLRTAYSGSALRVRRTVAPFDEQDIGFTAGGDLDEAAIVAFGGGDVLTVSAWYDQSGQSNDATRITPSQQPQIYNGTAVITENGRPAVDFTGTKTLQPSDVTFNPDNLTFTTVCTVNTLADMLFVKMGPSSNRFYVPQVNLTDVGIGWVANYDVIFGSSDTNQHLYSVYGTPSSDIARQDGAAQTLTSRSSTWSSEISIGGFNANSPSWDGTGQEIILWDTDHYDNRTGIETNINDYYNVYTVYNPDAPTSGLLFDYSGAAAAYSVRQLNNNATVSMRVRRAVAPFDEQDIGFVNGDLDEAAIATFGGTDPLTVSAWYDQSGQQNHSTQITPGNQPQIYNGTAVITENGKPAVQFDNTGLDQLLFTKVTTCKTVFSVCGTYGTSFSALLGGDTSSSTGDRNLRVINGNVWYLDNPGQQDWYKEANGDAYIDGSQVTGRPSAGSQQSIFLWNTSPDILYGFSSISNRYLNRGWYGSIQEIVIYENTDYIDSTNRTGIESDINTYYSIY